MANPVNDRKIIIIYTEKRVLKIQKNNHIFRNLLGMAGVFVVGSEVFTISDASVVVFLGPAIQNTFNSVTQFLGRTLTP